MALNLEFKKFELENVLTVTSKNEIECKLPGTEEDGVAVFVDGKVTLTAVEPLNGEIKYGGKVIFTIIKNLSGLTKSEIGVEFMYKAELKGATCEDNAFGKASVDNVKVSVVNGIPTVSAALIFEGGVKTSGCVEYLKNIGDANCKKQEVLKSSLVSKIVKPISVEDEFDLELVAKDVLWHYEKVKITSSECSIGSVITNGEIELGMIILPLASDTPIKEVKTIPFRIETDVKECMPSLTCQAALEIKSANLKVVVDENKNKSSVSFIGELNHNIAVYETESVNYTVDAYLKERELNFEKATCQAEEVLGENLVNGTISFKDAFKISKNTRLVCPLFVKIEQIDCSSTASELKFEGVCTVGVLLSDGAIYSVETALIPFSVSGTPFGDKRCVISAEAYNLQVETEKEGLSVKFDVQVKCFEYKLTPVSFITKVEEGDEKPVNKAAISVCIPKPENSLWDIAKSLGVTEEEILKTNENLTFPLTGDERIVVYREIK